MLNCMCTDTRAPRSTIIFPRPAVMAAGEGFSQAADGGDDKASGGQLATASLRRQIWVRRGVAMAAPKTHLQRRKGGDPQQPWPDPVAAGRTETDGGGQHSLAAGWQNGHASGGVDLLDGSR
ncbi:hypothetical protein ACLOJK_011693 [Asimina triloba]